MCLARRAFFFFAARRPFKKEPKKTFSEQSPLKNFDFGILDVKKMEVRNFTTDCTEIIRNKYYLYFISPITKSQYAIVSINYK
ncbi:hypothetical protein EGI31_14260 [Lacihabitans soyangensis]|uniref:Uncharacterized protein n=1 Tax=Lacihabitans soyangensis TaxID=869394 RepID=A0AAE3H3B4_9BACT|nr:hypothetical protein [Lacihabitans soyangensis]